MVTEMQNLQADVCLGAKILIFKQITTILLLLISNLLMYA